MDRDGGQVSLPGPEAGVHGMGLVAPPDREDHEALIRLRAALDTWMTETGDLGGLEEPPEIVAPFEKEMHDWFGTPDWVSKPPGD